MPITTEERLLAQNRMLRQVLERLASDDTFCLSGRGSELERRKRHARQMLEIEARFGEMLKEL